MARPAFKWDTLPDAGAESGGFDWGSIPDADAPGGLESFGRGVAQGGTLGFADEAEAAARAVGGLLTGEGWDYSGRRDQIREKYAAAEAADPAAFGSGQVVGGVGTAFIPGLGLGKGLAGALKTGAALGAAQGLGESEADLMEGQLAEAARDVTVGAGLGAGAGAVGHGLARGVGAVASKVAGRAGRGVTAAESEEAARQALKQAEREASAMGKYRSAVQSASRDLEVLGREAAELPEGTVRRQAAEFLGSPEGLAVREQVAANKLTTAPERISEMAQLRAEHAALAEGRDALIRQATDEALREPFKRQFAPRVATLGHRLIPAALAGAGGLLGGPEGAAAGAGLGGVVALTQGRPGIILRNLIRSPASRRAMWNIVQQAFTVSPEALGRFGRSLAAAFRQGGNALAEAVHAALLEQDPEYQTQVLGLLDTADGGT